MAVQRAVLGPGCARDAQRVEPEGLHLDRFADARRDHAVADLRVHPGELHPGHAGGEEPVGVHADAVARAGAVTGDDPADGVLQQLLVGRSQRDAARAGRLEQLVRRDHVPERGIDRVVFRLFARVREAVWHHAFGYRRRPGQQDVARQLQAAGQAHEAAQRDEGVAPPVGEPGIAGDDGPAGAAAHHVSVGRALERRPEAAPPARLRVEEPCRVQIGRRLAGAQHQRGVAAVQCPREHAGRGEILDVVEAAVPLGIVLEIAIPHRFVPVAAVGHRRDRRHARIWPPQHAPARDLGGEVEGLVLVVQRMVVAAREERAHHQLDGARQRAQAPTHDHVAALVAGDDLLRHLAAVVEAKGPDRPGLVFEAGDVPMAVGVDHVRGIALSAEREAAARRLEPHLEPVDQHHAAGRRRGRDEQQRMIATRADAGHGARCEPAQPVGLEPFAIQPPGRQRRSHDLDPIEGAWSGSR